MSNPEICLRSNTNKIRITSCGESNSESTGQCIHGALSVDKDKYEDYQHILCWAIFISHFSVILVRLNHNHCPIHKLPALRIIRIASHISGSQPKSRREDDLAITPDYLVMQSNQWWLVARSGRWIDPLLVYEQIICSTPIRCPAFTHTIHLVRGT